MNDGILNINVRITTKVIMSTHLDKSRIIFVRGPQHYVQTLNSRHGLIERAAVVHVRFQASHVQNGSFLHSHLESAFTAFVPDLDLLLVDICL